MENIRDRVDIKLRTKWGGRYGARTLIANPRFKKCTIFDEDLVAIELERNVIFMNKPIAIGMVILDISKILMCEFHYDHMKNQYGENVQLMYTGKKFKIIILLYNYEYTQELTLKKCSFFLFYKKKIQTASFTKLKPIVFILI